MTSLRVRVFQSRHIGPDADERDAMLKVVGAASLDALIDEAIPARIRLPTAARPARRPRASTSSCASCADVAAQNQVFRSYIGLGYYDCITPSVILRNVLENPGWYTPYTPYQAEIAQGRLEALLNFQTMVERSHRDGGRERVAARRSDRGRRSDDDAASRAGQADRRLGGRRSSSSPTRCFPQTIDVLRARAEPLGIELVDRRPRRAATFERPRVRRAGAVRRTKRAACTTCASSSRARKQAGVLVAVGDRSAEPRAADAARRDAAPTSCSATRSASACRSATAVRTRRSSRRCEEHVRQAPGRIIGVSVDAHGNRAYRMSLQTREQHIRREKATSNICTAQALLANIAGVLRGVSRPEGPDGDRRGACTR